MTDEPLPRRTGITAPELPDPMAPKAPKPAVASRRKGTSRIGTAISPEHMDKLDDLTRETGKTQRAFFEEWIDQAWAARR